MTVIFYPFFIIAAGPGYDAPAARLRGDAIHFDAAAFSMPTPEATMLDPQQRNLLELSAEVSRRVTTACMHDDPAASTRWQKEGKIWLVLRA
jgi:hypothetical protein